MPTPKVLFVGAHTWGAGKAATTSSSDGMPVHSFQTLLADLATIAKNRVASKTNDLEFDRITRPTPLQARALELLEVSL